MNLNFCPNCQLPIPPTAPGGFCPACVLRDAEEPAATGRPTPSLGQVAAAFPQFEILALIGQGGMGSVYKVRQPGLDRVVALKILCPELGRDPAFAERFAREARVLAKLKHPNIVTVFEHGESGGFFYLLMEFVDGVNLRQAMHAGRFTPEQALAVVPGVCDALQAAHAQGVWHRDIKPENILLDAQGAVKIVDFGIARLVGDPARDFTLTRTGAALGSAPYMAPEQHEKPHEVDHRADIYSLGVVIYEMLTGELPLGRFPAPSSRAAVSARIDEIVFQTLEKERELRQQSANEVKTDVQRATRDQATVLEAATQVSSPSSFGNLPRMVAWCIPLWIGGLVMGAIGILVMEQYRTATAGGAVLLGIGAVAAVIGLLGSLRALYEMKRGWIPPLGRVLLIALTIAPMVAGLLALALGISENFSRHQPKGSLLIYSAIVLSGTTLFGWLILILARPLSPVNDFRRKLGLIGWVVAIVFFVVGSLVAKYADGHWPISHYWQSGKIHFQHNESRLSDQEILTLARKAAGTYANDYQLVMREGVLYIRALSTTPDLKDITDESSHIDSLATRLQQLLPQAKIAQHFLNSRVGSSPSRGQAPTLGPVNIEVF